MGNAKFDRRSSGEYQDAVRAFVAREVIYCVSPLVWELRGHESDHPDYYDEISEAYYCEPDYCEAADYDARQKDRAELVEYFEGARGMAVYDDESPLEILEDDDEAREYCEYFGIDPEPVEIFEHWIVSEWLASRLADKGEKVIHDFMGLTLWGRRTTGQSICMDGVICDIYDELQGAK